MFNEPVDPGTQLSRVVRATILGSERIKSQNQEVRAVHITPIGTAVVHKGSVGEAGAMYTRLLAGRSEGPLAGVMFLTFERRLGVIDPGGPSFPVLRSEDGGATWTEVSSVRDVIKCAGNRYQPMLYELPMALGHLNRGDLLLTGNAIPADGSFTCLALYSSTDGGYKWDFESVIDEGGPAIYDPSADSTTTAVWEPDLHLIDGELFCYFADERLKHNGILQAIRRRRSRDLRNWSDVQLIKGVPDRFHRPGMFVGTGEMPDGKYRGVVEIVGPSDVPIHLLESTDGRSWGPANDLGTPLVSGDGVSLSGTPTISWRQLPGGRVIILALGRHSLRDGVEGNQALWSEDLGATWSAFDLPTAASRSIHCDLSGYSQSVAWNERGELVQATTLRNDVG